MKVSRHLLFTLFLAGALIFSVTAADALGISSSRDFVRRVSSVTTFEIAASNLALQRSQDPAVREFAQRTIDSRTQTKQYLREAVPFSDAATVLVMDTMNNNHLGMLNQLIAEGPDDFDEAYARAMRAARTESVALLGDYNEDGRDSMLRDFASQMLPVMQTDLATARDLASSR